MHGRRFLAITSFEGRPTVGRRGAPSLGRTGIEAQPRAHMRDCRSPSAAEGPTQSALARSTALLCIGRPPPLPGCRACIDRLCAEVRRAL